MPRLVKLIETERQISATRLRELKRLRPRLAPELRLQLDHYIDCLEDSLSASRCVLAARNGRARGPDEVSS